MAVIKRRSYVSVIIFVALIILQCEGRERFYRPDLPEQLCAIGLVDLDDTLSYGICNCSWYSYQDVVASSKKIYFEKSFQPEYADAGSFRDFSFRISDNLADMYVYHIDESARNPIIEVPSDLKFESGNKYYFHADENDVLEISSECIVPEMPPVLSLVSIKTGFSIHELPSEGCYRWVDGTDIRDWYKDSTYTRRSADIEFSFTNTGQESYYAVFLIGTPIDTFYDGGPGMWASNFLNYTLLETNTNGFFHTFKGGMTIQHYCLESPRHAFSLHCLSDTLNVYFLEGSNIPGGTCTLKLNVQWDYVQYIPSFVKHFRIRLMSLPREAYLFYKSLFTYKMERDDPFGELININGNIMGGNGIISLCRSRDLLVDPGQTGGGHDPFF